MKAPPYKIVLLGDSSVGKTSLAHRFTKNTFDQHTANTIGAAFITKEHTSSTDKNKTLKFEIWDTAGQERYRSLTPMYYRNAKVALICYDLLNVRETLEKAKEWVEQLRLNTDEHIEIRLVGTKKDIQEADLGDARDYAVALGVKLYFTSAKTGEGVLDIFDDIVNGLDEDFFTNYNERSHEPVPLDLTRHPKSRCC